MKDLAWIAGLYEGEGSIIFTRKSGLYLSLGSTDRDVLERLQDCIGAGGIYGPYDAGHKPVYHYRVPGKVAYATFVAIWPWLCSRRREQIATKVRCWLAVPTRGKHPR